MSRIPADLFLPLLTRPLVISGPSGVGKSTLKDTLLKEFPFNFYFSVSHTTRGPRPGEKHGTHYNFVTRANFEDDIKAGMFLEFAEFSGNLYGTPVQPILQNEQRCMLDIESQGVQRVKERIREMVKASDSSWNLNPIYVFICPPDGISLRERLTRRGTETEEVIKKRLKTARTEILYAKGVDGQGKDADGKDVYDLIIFNDKVEGDVKFEDTPAYQQFRDVAIGKEVSAEVKEAARKRLAELRLEDFD
ncbi:hypothetical protein EIP91_010836 [Steccherinum ochraceum]|uniref:guanylate kinase n=1 Tax=Steccherinum ochraceum TaxID=92696 RepID=A0A4R0RQF8_9APHY|nr:hypothetical protein EIP91_010836 [Steccherinum ochraceum]